MVNRKSRNANFLSNGSPRKKMTEQIVKKLAKKHQIKKKDKIKPNPPITWELSKDYFESLEHKRKGKLK